PRFAGEPRRVRRLGGRRPSRLPCIGDPVMTPDVNTMKTLEVLIKPENLDPDQWINFPEYGFRQYFLFKNPDTGASIAILEYEKGGRIPVKHTHASNQFMYCLEGDYEYTDVGLR